MSNDPINTTCYQILHFNEHSNLRINSTKSTKNCSQKIQIEHLWQYMYAALRHMQCLQINGSDSHKIKKNEMTIFIHHYLAMLILLQTSPCPSDEDLVPWDNSRPSASLSSPLSPFSVSSELCPLPPWPDKFFSLTVVRSVFWFCCFSFLSFRSLCWFRIFCFRLSSLSSAMPKGFIALKIKVQKEIQIR